MLNRMPTWNTVIAYLFNQAPNLKMGPASITAKFIVLHCAFCKIRRNFGFFCSVNHLSGPLRKHTFTCTGSKGPVFYLWFPSLFLSSIESFSAKLGEHVTLWFALTLPSLKRLTSLKKLNWFGNFNLVWKI